MVLQIIQANIQMILAWQMSHQFSSVLKLKFASKKYVCKVCMTVLVCSRYKCHIHMLAFYLHSSPCRRRCRCRCRCCAFIPRSEHFHAYMHRTHVCGWEWEWISEIEREWKRAEEREREEATTEMEPVIKQLLLYSQRELIHLNWTPVHLHTHTNTHTQPKHTKESCKK